MAIKLDILTEKLENISEGCYATDYVGDVVNWILNKPKPYRILYDSHFDVWVICDALENTHRGMALDLFDSDYLYSVAKNLGKYIQFARSDGKFNNGYTDAEVYSDYGFRKYLLKGLFFIPEGKNYEDYENSSFYSIETPITTGTIFTQLYDEFTPTGIFKDLYKKLDAAVAIKNTLPELLKQFKEKYGNEWLDYFYEEAEEWDYDEEEVQEFLNNYGILASIKESKNMFIREDNTFDEYIDVLQELGFEPNPEQTPNSWNKEYPDIDKNQPSLDLNVNLDDMKLELTWHTRSGRIVDEDEFELIRPSDIVEMEQTITNIKQKKRN